MSTKENIDFKPMTAKDLPPEFLRFDKPFGLEQHVWNIIYYGIITHVLGSYWLFYLLPMGHVPRMTFGFAVVYGYFGGLGISVGAHRYWTHRSFKANLPLQVLMMVMQTSALQYPIFKWCRDHRAHHKYMDGMADPHSAGRGFWFSHITWLFQPKHPECVKALETTEVSDMARDPLIRLQSKNIYYWELVIAWGFIIPITISHWLWPEMDWVALITVNFGRYMIMLHATFSLNSMAHRFGMDGHRPYDKGISPVENWFISLYAVGEGFHNYHHTFPWDYRLSEFGNFLNMGSIFIHSFAAIGWAWELKTVSEKMQRDRINRTGDGSHHMHDHYAKNVDEGDTSSRNVWGWGYEMIKDEDVEITTIQFPDPSG